MSSTYTADHPQTSCVDLCCLRPGKSLADLGAQLDVGGGATAEAVKKAFELLLSEKKVKSIFVNICESASPYASDGLS